MSDSFVKLFEAFSNQRESIYIPINDINLYIKFGSKKNGWGVALLSNDKKLKLKDEPSKSDLTKMVTTLYTMFNKKQAHTDKIIIKANKDFGSIEDSAKSYYDFFKSNWPNKANEISIVKDEDGNKEVLITRG